MDFWRPNYRSTALVDGKYSTKIYLKSLKQAWEHFREASSLAFNDFQHFCYHLPFTRMAQKAHKHLAKLNKSELTSELLDLQIEDSLLYNRIIGNSYSASMYIGLVSLLENCKQNLAGKRVGFFSYGSGCVAEFFSGRIVAGYEQYLHSAKHQAMLAARSAVSYDEYLKLYNDVDPVDGGEHQKAEGTTGRFRLAAVSHHKREYIAC